MKRLIAVILLAGILLSGCSTWMNKEYVSIEPYLEKNDAHTDSVPEVASFTQLRDALVTIVESGKPDGTVIVAALEQEIVHYNDLLHNFREHHKSDLRLIKHQLRNETYIHFDEEDLKREEVRNLIIEEIEKNPALANEWGINYSCEKYPDIAITLIKYWKKDTIENLISYKK